MPALELMQSPLDCPTLERIQLDGSSYVIGRDPHRARILIPDDRNGTTERSRSVSRAHCEIYQENGCYYLQDLRSKNGTYLSRSQRRTRLEPHRPVRLQADDRIEICDFVFRFRDDDDPPLEVLAVHDFLVAPSDRLHFLLKLSRDPARSAELGPLLDQLADNLFRTKKACALNLDHLLRDISTTLLAVFKRASRCLILMRTSEDDLPVPKLIRGPDMAATVSGYNRTLVRYSLDAVQAHLVTEQMPDGRRTSMCTPLATSEGTVLGAVVLESMDCERPFTTDDLHLLAVLGNLASVAIERALVHEEERTRAVVQNQLELARRALLGFLPQKLPTVPGYEFFSHYSPAQTVGGDYYDFVPLPGDRLAVVLGDVAGKGIPAALLVAKLSSEVRYALLSEPDPARAVALLNTALITSGTSDKFVTLVLMVLDSLSHRLTVVSAGHPSPRLYSSRQRRLSCVISESATGLPLGIRAGNPYEAVTIPLEVGDTVVSFTDGITDAMNAQGEPFGSDAVDLYLSLSDSPPPEGARPALLASSLISFVQQHAAGCSPADDIAVVAFGRWSPDNETGTVVQPPPGSNRPTN